MKTLFYYLIAVSVLTVTSCNVDQGLGFGGQTEPASSLETLASLKQGTDSVFTLYVRDFHNRTFLLEVSPCHTISDLHEMIYDRTGIVPDQQRLTCGAKELSLPSRTLFEYQIGAEMTIQIQATLRGGGRFTFASLDDKSREVKQFGNSAPKWRTLCYGFSLEGRCDNNECDAYNEMVWCIPGFDYGTDRGGEPERCFDMGFFRNNAQCPICHQRIGKNSAISCAFYRCKHTHKGIDADGNYIEETREAPYSGSFEYHNGEKSLMEWQSLRIYVEPLSSSADEQVSSSADEQDIGVDSCLICFESLTEEEQKELSCLQCGKNVCSSCFRMAKTRRDQCPHCRHTPWETLATLSKSLKR